MALAGCTSIPEIAAATVRHESELPPTAQLDSDRAGPVVEGV
jgi:hypothetical protein